MPFLKVDFSTYDSSNLIQKNLRSQFMRLFRPIQLVLVLMCCRITCLRRKSRRRCWISKLHTTFIILILLIVLMIIIPQLWYSLQHFPVSENASETAVSIWQLQGIINMIFLIYWDRNAIGNKLRQHLMATSTGIGVLRRKLLLNSIHLAAIIFGSLISVLSITYKVLLIIFNNHLTKVPLNLNLLQHFQWPSVAVSAYVAFSYPAVYAEVCSLISVICAEFRTLNDDFADDCNTYQLPVIRHYVGAHWRLSQAHILFHRSLSFWMSFHLLTSSMSCIYLCQSLANSLDRLISSEPITVAIFTCAVLLVALVLSQIIFSLIMCITLHYNITHFRYLLIALIAGNTALHEQTYSVATAYTDYLYRSRAGISFFEISVVDRRFIEQVIVVSFLIAAIYHFNNSGKYVRNGCTKTVPVLGYSA